VQLFPQINDNNTHLRFQVNTYSKVFALHICTGGTGNALQQDGQYSSENEVTKQEAEGTATGDLEGEEKGMSKGVRMIEVGDSTPRRVERSGVSRYATEIVFGAHRISFRAPIELRHVKRWWRRSYIGIVDGPSWTRGEAGGCPLVQSSGQEWIG
jgi:hypothetical protein